MKIYVAANYACPERPVVMQALQEAGHTVFDHLVYPPVDNVLDIVDACVLVQPCSIAAPLEAGYVAGRGKRVVVLLTEPPATKPVPLWFGSAVASIPDLLKQLEQQ